MPNACQLGGSEIQSSLRHSKRSAPTCNKSLCGRWPVSLLVSSCWGGACGQSTRALHPAASRHRPNRGLSCSSGRCAAARWRLRTLAWPGKGRRMGGWPRAGGCLEPSSCHRAAALQRWQTSRGQGSGERSPCLLHTIPVSGSAGKTRRDLLTGHMSSPQRRTKTGVQPDSSTHFFQNSPGGVSLYDDAQS